MAAVQRPAAPVEADLDDAAVVVVVGGAGQRKLDLSAVRGDVNYHFLESARGYAHVVHILDRDVLGEPGLHLLRVALEGAHALDAAPLRMMQLGLTGERPDQRVGLPGHQAVEEGHRGEVLDPAPFLYPGQRGGGEELWRPRHLASIPRISGA